MRLRWRSTAAAAADEAEVKATSARIKLLPRCLHTHTHKCHFAHTLHICIHSYSRNLYTLLYNPYHPPFTCQVFWQPSCLKSSTEIKFKFAAFRVLVNLTRLATTLPYSHIFPYSSLYTCAVCAHL